jgi:hypothetical protein
MVGDFDDSLSMTLLRGAIRSITGWVGKFDRRSYQLTAGTSTVGIRGTDHEVVLIAQGEEGPDEVAGVHSWVNSGGTTLKNAEGSMDIEPGHAAWVGEDGRAPRAHNGIPAFLQRRRTRQEERATRHSLNIREIIETRLLRRGLLKRGERLEDAQRRHRLLHKRWERRQD